MVATGDLTKDTDGFTYKGLSFLLGGGKFKFGSNNNAAGDKALRFQFGGTGSMTKANVSFAVDGPGTLVVEAVSGGTTARALAVNVDGTELPTQEAPASGDGAVKLTFDCSAASAGSKITIYSTNSGINVFSVVWTPQGGSGGGDTGTAYVWGLDDVTAMWDGFAQSTGDINAAALSSMTETADLKKDADGFTYKGLSFLLGGGKFKFGSNNNADGVKTLRFQFGGTGSVTKANVSFTVDAPGTLVVEAVAGGSVAEKARPLAVAIDGAEVATQDTPDSSGNAQKLSFDCSSASAGSKITIYSKNSGINVFSITWTPSN